MKLDLDKLDEACEWKLTIKALGKEYAVRPLTIADAAKLQKLASGEGDVAQLAETVKTLFTGEPPPLEQMRMEKLLAVVSGILRYWQGVVAKNSRAIADAVGSAMAEQSPAGEATKAEAGPGVSSTPA